MSFTHQSETKDIIRMLKEEHDLMFIDRAVAQYNEREARKWSATWKAKAKQQKERADAAERRVQELEFHRDKCSTHEQLRADAAEKALLAIDTDNLEGFAGLFFRLQKHALDVETERADAQEERGLVYHIDDREV